ncbi:MAG: hypothetical protein ACREMV_06975 [Gemmatimonadales bacterium]
MSEGRRSMRRARGTRLAAFVLAGLWPAAGAGQLAVDRLELFLEPGAAQQVASFEVTNEGDHTIEATVYLQDWERRVNGEQVFSASGSLAQSCGQYLKVFPLSLRLESGGRQAVRVALEGAVSLRSACWSVVFVETAPEAPRAGRQIAYVLRLGVKVYVLPQGLASDGEVDTLLVRARPPRGAVRPDPGAREFVVSFTNSGGQPLWARGRVEIRRLDNSVAASVEVPEFPVLPGARRESTVDVPVLGPGRYVALALIDYGGAEIAAAQIELELP